MAERKSPIDIRPKTRTGRVAAGAALLAVGVTFGSSVLARGYSQPEAGTPVPATETQGPFVFEGDQTQGTPAEADEQRLVSPARTIEFMNKTTQPRNSAKARVFWGVEVIDSPLLTKPETVAQPVVVTYDDIVRHTEGPINGDPATFAKPLSSVVFRGSDMEIDGFDANATFTFYPYNAEGKPDYAHGQVVNGNSQAFPLPGSLVETKLANLEGPSPDFNVWIMEDGTRAAYEVPTQINLG